MAKAKETETKKSKTTAKPAAKSESETKTKPAAKAKAETKTASKKCASKSKITAKAGDTIKINYTGSYDDGVIFNSSYSVEPLEFILGQGSVIKGFDNAIEGMAPGEKKTVVIEPKDAYGEHKKGLVFVLDRTEVPEGVELKVGQVMQMSMDDNEGRVINVLVMDVNSSTLTVDGNHPLAGKRLSFDIKLLEIA